MELLGGTLGSGDQVIFGAGKPLAVQLITIILPSSASSNTSLFGSVIVLGSINMRENHDMKRALLMATISEYKDVIWKDGTSD